MVFTVHEQIKALECDSSNDTLHAEVDANLAELRRLLMFLQQLVQNESAERREMWKNRVQGLEQELYSISKDRDKLRSRHMQRQREGDMRNELMAGRAGNELHNKIDSYVSEHDSLLRSNAMVDQQLGMGQNALQSLARQRNALKSSRRKVLDIANTMGTNY